MLTSSTFLGTSKGQHPLGNVLLLAKLKSLLSTYSVFTFYDFGYKRSFSLKRSDIDRLSKCHSGQGTQRNWTTAYPHGIWFISFYIYSIYFWHTEGIGKNTVEYAIISFKLVSLLKPSISEYNFTVLPVSNGCQKTFFKCPSKPWNTNSQAGNR